MKIIVANRDRSDDLGQQLAAAARERADRSVPGAFSPQHSALSLKKARTGTEYLSAFIRLLRIRGDLKTTPFDIPAKPGIHGRLSAGIKKFLWKVLRYQHDRMAFQQQIINELMTCMMEFEKASREKEIHALKRRVAALEVDGNAAAGNPTDGGNP